jgi:hypothetical protein
MEEYRVDCTIYLFTATRHTCLLDLLALYWQAASGWIRGDELDLAASRSHLASLWRCVWTQYVSDD